MIFIIITSTPQFGLFPLPNFIFFFKTLSLFYTGAYSRVCSQEYGNLISGYTTEEFVSFFSKSNYFTVIFINMISSVYCTFYPLWTNLINTLYYDFSNDQILISLCAPMCSSFLFSPLAKFPLAPRSSTFFFRRSFYVISIILYWYTELFFHLCLNREFLFWCIKLSK